MPDNPMSNRPPVKPKLHRQRVTRSDGKAVQVVQKRGHLSYCVTGCCCGHTDRGYAPVPVDAYKREWLGRRLRNTVHLTKAGCLGPCALANVASLVFDGHSIWFHSVGTAWQISLIFDYLEAMIQAGGYLSPPAELREYVFDFYDWEARALTPDSGAKPEPTSEGFRVAFLSHADTDLLTLQQALPDVPAELGHVFSANLSRFKDEAQLYALLEAELADAEIIVLRLHGSLETVPAFSALRSQALARGQHLLVLSGLNELSPTFAKASTVPKEVLAEATAYLGAGGAQNVRSLLTFLSDRLTLTALGYDAPQEMPAHGFYHPNLPEQATAEDWLKLAQPGRPTAAVIFYRAHYLSGNLAFIDTLLEALETKGMNAVGVFTASLREVEDGVPVALKDLQGQVDVLISTLAFAVGRVSAGEVTQAGVGVAVLERLGVPVVQAITSGMVRGAWEASSRELNALDTAMNVALPEFDGRIVGVPVSFKVRAENGVSVY